MKYRRMPIEKESPEELGYETIKYNLAESSYTDTHLKDLNIDLKKTILCYGDHLGNKELRQLLARRDGLEPNNFLITPGAASALFIINTSLLEKEDHLIVIRPNYATNIETPLAIGCSISYLQLDYDHQFQFSLKDLEILVKPNTKLVSITYPHNPTGVVFSKETMTDIIEFTKKKGLTLLVDETYRDHSTEELMPVASTISEHIVSVSSVSKAYGLPGIRVGWLSTGGPELMEKFLAAKEQIFICGSVVDEEIAYQYLVNVDQYMPLICSDLAEKRRILLDWYKKQNIVEMIIPTGGVVCFPRFCRPDEIDLDLFYHNLLNEFKAYVGPGHWFEMPKSYFRLGYGWPSQKELIAGLDALLKCYELSRKNS